MKTLGYALAVVGVLMVGCATEYWPGKLVTVEVRGAAAPVAATESGSKSIDEQAALAQLSPEDKQLLSAIHETEKEHGFTSSSWSVQEGALRYESFRPSRSGEQSSPIWLQVDWSHRTVKLFGTVEIERVGVIADSLSQKIRAAVSGAQVTVTDDRVPARLGVF